MTVSGDTSRRFGRLLDAQPAEEAHLDDPALPLVDLRQRLQRIVERDQIVPGSSTTSEPSSNDTFAAPPPRFW